ncbi:MAG: peptidoglycan-associated lipoprotein Pal [Pseudomonadota bacterium]|nr:peptidoglycan-associated lipoprotein Pal [Pseudomonadota bacterium]
MISRSRRMAAATLVLVTLLGACSSTPSAPPAPAPAPVAAKAPAPAAAPAAVAAPAAKPAPMAAPKVEAARPIPAYLDPNSALYRDRQLFFAFDTARVDDKYAGLLDEHAAFLSSNPGVHVAVEGNCDERGSAEYNLALGQRRADAVVKALQSRGVAAGQLESRSWGKEKPLASGHDEDSWARNRRADLVYPDH